MKERADENEERVRGRDDMRQAGRENTLFGTMHEKGKEERLEMRERRDNDMAIAQSTRGGVSASEGVDSDMEAEDERGAKRFKTDQLAACFSALSIAHDSTTTDTAPSLSFAAAESTSQLSSSSYSALPLSSLPSAPTNFFTFSCSSASSSSLSPSSPPSFSLHSHYLPSPLVQFVKVLIRRH